MAQAFGVSANFLDRFASFSPLFLVLSSSDGFHRDLARYITLGRVNCKIDKVAGVVETEIDLMHAMLNITPSSKMEICF